MSNTKYEDRSLKELMSHYSFERKENNLIFTIHDIEFKENDCIVIHFPQYRELGIIIGRDNKRYIGDYAPPIVERYGGGGTQSEHILDSSIGLNKKIGKFQIKMFIFGSLHRLSQHHINKWTGIDKSSYHKVIFYRDGCFKQVIDPENIET